MTNLLRVLQFSGLLVLGSSVAGSTAYAQRTPEISGSIGVSLSAASLGHSTAPAGFSGGASFQLAAQLRTMFPLTPHLGLTAGQHITGLSPMLQYRSQYGRQGTGVGAMGLLHTSLGLQYLDIFSIGPRWNIDAGLTVGYAYQLRRSLATYNWFFTAGGNTNTWPEPDQPLVLLNTHFPRRMTPLAGASLQVHYTFPGRQFLLFSLDYQRGLLPLVEVSTQRLEYLDNMGTIQQGNITLRHRGSYVTAQLGYGWSAFRPPCHW
ncbi:hypothetical protein [Hymenobacter sublimis]|uniref:Outer membrane protein beta-barrel domain-containing protein n=1 Tax=Hymenobacter sublimis TaxID=2933777 RepID=A0ABY4J8H9_9BACT|nr:hypothetical protein [Hymenobacter sublimis]UPL48288.1 hypothetical protein MWH26_13955 [Hymenobacter sublimis]